MKKFLNLSLFLVSISHYSAFAQSESMLEINPKNAQSEKPSTLQLEVEEAPNSTIGVSDEAEEEPLRFYTDERNIDKYDFIASELIANQNEAGTNPESIVENGQDSQVLNRRIQLDLAEGNIVEALPLIQKLVIQDPANLANYNLLAEAYVLTGAYDDAARTYHHLVEMLYLTDESVLMQSPYFAILKKFHEFGLPLDEQLMIFKDLAAMEEYDTFPMILLAGFLIDNSKFYEAESYLERALQIDPSNPKIYTLYSFIYWNEGTPEKAVALLEEAYNKYQNPEIGLELANALIANFEYERAYKQLVSLMILTNEAPVVFEKFIGMAYVMGNYDNIQNMLNMRLDQPEVLTRAVLNLFYFSEILGNSENLLQVLPEIDDPTPEYAEAIATIKAKVALLAKDYTLFNQYFDEMEALGNSSEAELALKKMLMLQGTEEYDLLDEALAEDGELLAEENSANLAFLRAMSAFGHQDYDKMVEIFREEIRQNPQDPIAYNALGFSLVEIDPKNAVEALPLITKANLMMPGQDFIEDSLAWTYYQLGDLARAEKYIKKAYHKNKDPEIISHYIVILDALGKKAQAEELYRKFNLFFRNSDKRAILLDNVNWIKDITPSNSVTIQYRDNGYQKNLK